jgi:hypothetical protein
MNVNFHFRHPLSAGGPGSLLGALGSCGVSRILVPSVPIKLEYIFKKKL